MTPIQSLAALAALARTATRDVPSPCISICRMDASSGLCLGCFRTIDEIMVWGRQGDPERRAVWRQIVRRAGLDAAPVPMSDTLP